MKIVILAAGFGSRLWPLSTPGEPKQFQPIIAGRSPLQYTFDLFTQIAGNDEVYVLTLQGHEQLVTEQLPSISVQNILAVPERRNTLPHTIFALHSIAESDDEPVLFTTVDHLILEENAFIDSVKQILNDGIYNKNHVTLFGNRSKLFDPNAGYFSIDSNGQILAFKEKPSQQDIEQLEVNGTSVIKDTAMFIATKSNFGAALATINNEIAAKGQLLLTATADERHQRFLAMPLIDIATSFYEKATNLHAALTAGDFVDLGSFGSLYKVSEKDEQGNVISGNVIVDRKSHNNYIFNQSDNPLVVININDSVMVQATEGTVIAPKSDINSVGEIYKSQIFQKP